MIVGDSFGATNFPDGRWNTEVDAGVSFSTSQATGSADVFYGAPSELFSFKSGSGTAGLSNRGECTRWQLGQHKPSRSTQTV
jgi:hypothetical protein